VDLILYSGPVVKAVLLILLFFSILSWAIIFSKFRLIRLAITSPDPSSGFLGGQAIRIHLRRIEKAPP